MQNVTTAGRDELATWVAGNVAPLVTGIAPDYFRSKRWFGSKGRDIASLALIDSAVWTTQPVTVLALVRFDYATGPAEFYHVPLLVQPTAQADAAAQIASPYGTLSATDALTDDAFCRSLYHAMYAGRDIGTAEGDFVFVPIAGRLVQPEAQTVKRIATEQSNTSIVYNGALILKVFRKLAAGLNPDFEVPYFLSTRADFPYVPALGGYIEYRQHSGGTVSMGVLADFVENSGDGFVYSLDALRGYFRTLEAAGQPLLYDAAAGERATAAAQPYAAVIRQLGAITGQMHNALASDAAKDDAAFAPEAISDADVAAWQTSIRANVDAVLATIRTNRNRYPAHLHPQLDLILANVGDYQAIVDGLTALADADVAKIRYHGDYHLGQVLRTHDGFVILDFEGEPARPLVERRMKNCPLKDVVGMLRSFNYAAFTVLFEEQARLGVGADTADLEKYALAWEDVARTAFLDGYTEAVRGNTGARFLPESPAVFQQALDVFEVEKAFYELNYEINNRPDWIPIPLKGLHRIRDARQG